MKKRTFIFTILMTLALIMSNQFAFAAAGWWDDASTWYSGGKTSVGIGSNVLEGLADTLEIIGTAVIAIATVVIGMKYMFGTVQGKVDAKENLITLLVACLFFFGWTNIRGLIITGNATGANGLTGATQLIFFKNGNLENAFAAVFTFVVFIAKTLCVFAIMYMGVKYVFAGAGAKAELKEKTPAMIIGVILTFCAVEIVTFIANTATSIV